MFSIPTILQIYHPEPLPFILGKCLGQGNQGIVYEDLNDTTKVIKLSIIYDDFNKISLDDKFVLIEKIYKYIINNPHSSVVKIYSFDKLYSGSQPIFEWEHKYIVYYSIMEKLNILSENEVKVFKTICDAFNKDLKSERSIEEILKEMKDWFDVDDKKILNFYNSLSDLKINNKDFQPRNIMKDKDNNYYIIDFDLANFN